MSRDAGRLERLLGAAALTAIVILGFTGILLATGYAPTPDHAYESVRELEQGTRWGAIVRGLHAWGGVVGLIALLCWATTCLAVGGEGRAKGSPWRRGLGLTVLLVVSTASGSMLPWDRGAQWSAVVASRLAESVPGVGEALSVLVRGPREGGASALLRASVLHTMLLPPLLLWGALAFRRATRAADRRERWVGCAGGALASTAILVLGLSLGASLDLPRPPTFDEQPEPPWPLVPLGWAMRLEFPPWGVLAFGAVGVLFFWTVPLLRPTPPGLRRRRVLAAAFAVLSAVLVIPGFGSLVRGRDQAPDAPSSRAPTPDSPPFLRPEGTPPDSREWGDSMVRISDRARGLLGQQGCLSCHRSGGPAVDLEGALRGASEERLRLAVEAPEVLHAEGTIGDVRPEPSLRDREVLRFFLGGE